MKGRALGDAEPDWASLNLVGRSPSFVEALGLLQQCAAVDATVLVCGETGTGKELAAHAIHYLSGRRSGPFVPVNCGALPDSLVEAELFGHTRGAFTDAKTDSRGVVGLAQGGTLFLDELDALSPRAQSAILRFVQDRSYRPLGSSRMQQADVRLVAATNVDLEAVARAGRFRQDLLFRVNVLSVQLPPLREREGDALLLANAFTHRLVRQYGTGPRVLAPASVEHLRAPLPWPGNVRELEHRVHRTFLLGKGQTLDLQLDAQAALARPCAIDAESAGNTGSFAEAKARVICEFERRYLSDVLARAGGNMSLAARIAGKERSRFGKLVRRYGLHHTSPARAFGVSPRD